MCLRDCSAELLDAYATCICHQHGDVVARARLCNGKVDTIPLAAVETRADDGMKDSQPGLPLDSQLWLLSGNLPWLVRQSDRNTKAPLLAMRYSPGNALVRRYLYLVHACPDLH